MSVGYRILIRSILNDSFFFGFNRCGTCVWSNINEQTKRSVLYVKWLIQFMPQCLYKIEVTKRTFDLYLLAQKYEKNLVGWTITDTDSKVSYVIDVPVGFSSIIQNDKINAYLTNNAPHDVKTVTHATITKKIQEI